jgi:hypothetical protein
MRIEAPKATRKMSEAEHRIAPNHRIAVTRKSHTTVLREFAIVTLGRKLENPVDQLHRVIPLERRLRNPRPVQLRKPPIDPTSALDERFPSRRRMQTPRSSLLEPNA